MEITTYEEAIKQLDWALLEQLHRTSKAAEALTLLEKIGKEGCKNTFEVTKVIFNGVATIVFWSDGSKSVAKCSKSDTYDKEKGLAMAIALRFVDKENFDLLMNWGE